MDDFDADVNHPWATRWRIPRVTTSYPRWRYEVALAVPTPGDTFQLDGHLLEPTETEAAIIGCYIDYRRSYYREGWAAQMLERAFDVDSSTNTVILALTMDGWKYRRETFRHGLWPLWNMPEKQAKYPPAPAGLMALLDHINWGTGWTTWKASHPDALPAGAQSAGDLL